MQVVTVFLSYSNSSPKKNIAAPSGQLYNISIMRPRLYEGEYELKLTNIVNNIKQLNYLGI